MFKVQLGTLCQRKRWAIRFHIALETYLLIFVIFLVVADENPTFSGRDWIVSFLGGISFDEIQTVEVAHVAGFRLAVRLLNACTSKISQKTIRALARILVAFFYYNFLALLGSSKLPHT